MKKRLNSLDFFRGVCITWMIFGHLAEWWMSHESFYLLNDIVVFVDVIGGSGFLFISGISLTLSYRNKIERIKTDDAFSYEKLRLNYILRAIFLLIVGFIYNTVDAILSNNLSLIWNWFILFTLPTSILLAWPLLKCKKIVKIVVAAAIIIIDHYLYSYLVQFKNLQGHPLSVIFYFLYNGYQLTPILSNFPFFLIGTVIADIIFENYINREPEMSHVNYFSEITLPLVISGLILMLIASFIIPLPLVVEDFLWHRRNTAWVIYAVGALVFLYPTLFNIEKLDFIHIDKKYRFFFYFSYYSFSIFLIHYSFYFFFTHILTWPTFTPIIIITIVSVGLLLKLIYNTLGNKFSLKYQLARLADGITTEILRIMPKFKESNTLLST